MALNPLKGSKQLRLNNFGTNPQASLSLNYPN